MNLAVQPRVRGDVISATDTAECAQEAGAKTRALYPTIFHEEWWLEAATHGRFSVAEVKRGGEIVGRLPYLLSTRVRRPVVRPPALTYFLGPAVDEGTGSSNTRFLRRLGITRELIAMLPPADCRYIKCHAAVTEAIAFQELDFRTYVQFTHEIAPDHPESVWRRFRDKTRNVIRRAREQFSVQELDDPEHFVRIYSENLAFHGEKNQVDPHVCRQLLRAALDRGRARILVARDRMQRPLAANVCVWDAQTCFYLLASRTALAGNGAVSLLLWESIQHAIRRNLLFDFAGLGGSGSVLFYAGFGATIQPRYVAVQARLPWRIMSRFKRSLTGENFFF